jgi:hypothetical protein
VTVVEYICQWFGKGGKGCNMPVVWGERERLVKDGNQILVKLSIAYSSWRRLH